MAEAPEEYIDALNLLRRASERGAVRTFALVATTDDACHRASGWTPGTGASIEMLGAIELLREGALRKYERAAPPEAK